MGNFRTLRKEKNYFKKQSRYKRQTKTKAANFSSKQHSKRQKYLQSGDLIYIQINYYLEVRVK